MRKEERAPKGVLFADLNCLRILLASFGILDFCAFRDFCGEIGI